MEDLYEKYKDIIEELADQYKDRKFGYFDQDDMKQEVRRICIHAIKSFDEDKASPKTYLSHCVSNRIKNLKRDLYFRIENPCVQKKCAMFNVFTNECTSMSFKSVCSKKMKSKQKMATQMALMNTANIDDMMIEDNNLDKTLEVEAQDTIRHIREVLVEASGQKFGIEYDKLIIFGRNHLKEDILSAIEEIAQGVIYNG